MHAALMNDARSQSTRGDDRAVLPGPIGPHLLAPKVLKLVELLIATSKNDRFEISNAVACTRDCPLEQ
jgi:hypothetical protein